MDKLKELGYEALLRLLYSPDLSPTDFTYLEILITVLKEQFLNMIPRPRSIF